MFDTDQPSWKNPRVLGVLFVVFLGGAASGAVIMQYRLHDVLHRPKSEYALSYDRLAKELNLNPQQQRQLKTILDDYAHYRQELQDQLNEWQATGKDQILRILDPVQRSRFEELTHHAEQ
jgi:hypothetical protein